MKPLKIRRLYLENYKLFTSKEIIFDDNLMVFGGPNGYGKTSIFDAIEFLIMGTISRVANCDAITGTLSYTCNFLSRDPKKDTIIKGEFASEDSTIIFAKRISPFPNSSNVNNPKKIESQAKTFILPQYSLPTDVWGEYEIDIDEVPHLSKDIFGIRGLEQFSLAHYMQQENRLSYFNSSEGDRTKFIQRLFGLEEELVKQEKIDTAQKQLKKKLDDIRITIDGLKDNLEKLNQNQNDIITYERITEHSAIWDQEVLGFKGKTSEAAYFEMKQQVLSLCEFLHWKNQFLVTHPLQEFSQLTSKDQALNFIAAVFVQKYGDKLEEFSSSKRNLEALNTQYQEISKQSYLSVDYKTLTRLLDKSDLTNRFISLVQQAQEIAKNQTDLEKSILEIKDARSQFHSYMQNLDSPDGKCPYCGQNWESNENLESQFASTSNTLSEVLGRENTAYSDIIKQICDLFQAELHNDFVEKRQELNNSISLQIFSLYPTSNDIIIRAKKMQQLLQAVGMQKLEFQLGKTTESCLQEATQHAQTILNLLNDVPIDYIEADKIYSFAATYKTIFNQDKSKIKVSLEQAQNKLLYLQQQYYQSFDSDRSTLQKLLAEEPIISKIYEQMNQYSKANQKALKSYRELIIQQIEIPFFLYTSRILQSYQGGQGVLLKSDGRTIRFTSPKSEHDVLYTMSSGQLSAILLSFSLAINKIYATEKFQTLLIDDPIQCMDDINMISFIEVLRCDFSNVQVILSTHEDLFAKYIIYKYEKYNLSGKSLSLKDA